MLDLVYRVCLACLVVIIGGWACGDNGSSGGGDGSSSGSQEKSFKQVSAGPDGLVCGVTQEDKISCWAMADDVTVPDEPPEGSYRSVAVGESRLCGIKTDGSILCKSYLGGGSEEVHPGDFESLSLWDGTAVCGVEADGSAECWANAESPAGTFKEVAVGRSEHCGLHTDGTVECWKTVADEPSDEVIAAKYQQIDMGQSHGCGIKIDGTLSCWGTGGLAPQ